MTKNIGSLIIESSAVLENDLLQVIGEVSNSNILKINTFEFNIEKLLEAWKGTFEELFPTAEEKKIPFQRHATSRVTGTDTDAFAYSNGGVASALISLPLRYMHTTVEMVHKDDVENVIKLIYESLLKIENNHNFSYFKK